MYICFQNNNREPEYLLYPEQNLHCIWCYREQENQRLSLLCSKLRQSPPHQLFVYKTKYICIQTIHSRIKLTAEKLGKDDKVQTHSIGLEVDGMCKRYSRDIWLQSKPAFSPFPTVYVKLGVQSIRPGTRWFSPKMADYPC